MIGLENLSEQDILGLAVIAGLATCSVVDLETELVEFFDQITEDLRKVLTA